MSGNVTRVAIAPASATPSASSRCGLYTTALYTARLAAPSATGGTWWGSEAAAAKMTAHAETGYTLRTASGATIRATPASSHTDGYPACCETSPADGRISMPG